LVLSAPCPVTWPASARHAAQLHSWSGPRSQSGHSTGPAAMATTSTGSSGRRCASNKCRSATAVWIRRAHRATTVGALHPGGPTRHHRSCVRLGHRSRPSASRSPPPASRTPSGRPRAPCRSPFSELAPGGVALPQHIGVECRGATTPTHEARSRSSPGVCGVPRLQGGQVVWARPCVGQDRLLQLRADLGVEYAAEPRQPCWGSAAQGR
jgi:hypothetical protein